MTAAEALARLRRVCPAGATLYTRVQRCAASGMQRDIVVLAIIEGEIVNVSWWIARALGLRARDGAVIVRGCGMDMGFALIYALSHGLWPEGPALSQRWV